MINEFFQRNSLPLIPSPSLLLLLCLPYFLALLSFSLLLSLPSFRSSLPLSSPTSLSSFSSPPSYNVLHSPSCPFLFLYVFPSPPSSSPSLPSSHSSLSPLPLSHFTYRPTSSPMLDSSPYISSPLFFFLLPPTSPTHYYSYCPNTYVSSTSLRSFSSSPLPPHIPSHFLLHVRYFSLYLFPSLPFSSTS